ncbi:MAG: winged helix-turn-helix domain-containing protein [Chromatiales bacterium]|nr:winged helix-turn-helix domain-containing protein [Chromatiales bacterium]
MTRDGITVHLTPKEYAVLQALVSHPGRVVTQTATPARALGSDACRGHALPAHRHR